MSTMNTNVRKFKQRKRFDRNGTFYEHDTRHMCNKLRSTVKVINETHLNNVQFQTQNICQAKFDSVHRLRKKLLKQQQQIRMQLQALQAHSCVPSLVCSSCCAISCNTKETPKSMKHPHFCSMQKVKIKGSLQDHSGLVGFVHAFY